MASTSFSVFRHLMIALLATGFAPTPAAAAPACKPVIGFKEVRFSPTHRETLERTWSASLSVDASRCATTSGHFQILFSRSKENAPEDEFVEPFTWHPGAVDISVNFWADEAVEAYWLHKVAACPCRE